MTNEKVKSTPVMHALRKKLRQTWIPELLVLTLEGEALKRKYRGEKAATLQSLIDEYLRKGLKSDGIVIVGENGRRWNSTSSVQ